MIIAIEGIDKAGKQTQASVLSIALEKQHLSSKILHFPDYSTHVGKEITRHLKTRSNMRVLHCLQAANKWESLDVIQDACQKYDVVIIDRYLTSNIVYGMANQLDKLWLENLERGLPKTDLNILLDISVDESFRRSPDNRDKFEENRSFLERVRSEYQKMAESERWLIVDANRTKEEIHQDIFQYVISNVIK